MARGYEGGGSQWHELETKTDRVSTRTGSFAVSAGLSATPAFRRPHSRIAPHARVISMIIADRLLESEHGLVY